MPCSDGAARHEIVIKRTPCVNGRKTDQSMRMCAPFTISLYVGGIILLIFLHSYIFLVSKRRSHYCSWQSRQGDVLVPSAAYPMS